MLRLDHKKEIFEFRPPPDPELYYFDETEANRAIAFISMLRLPKGKKAGMEWAWMPWQMAYIRELFGWRRRDNGLRAYLKTLLYIARKASKSTSAAAIALYMLMVESVVCGEYAPEIPLAAKDRSQATKLFRALEIIIQFTPEIKDRLKLIPSKGRIEYPANHGFIEVVSSDGGNAMGGDLYGALIDELHVIGMGRGSTGRGAELKASLTTGSGARSTRLIIYMTTAGVSLEDDTWWGGEYKYAKAVEEGTIVDDNYLPAIFEADKDGDPFDPAEWYKANPSLGYTVQESYYHEMATEARNDPSRLNDFLRLYLNIPAAAHDAWIPQHDLQLCRASLGKALGRRCWLGCDLSSTRDLTTIAAVWEPGEDNRIDVEQISFVPEDGLLRKEKEDMIPYERLASEGRVIVCPGRVIDYGFVQREIERYCSTYNVQSVGFDRYNTSHLLQLLTNQGIEVVGIGQGYLGITTAVKAVERCVYSLQFRYDDDLIEIAIGNAIATEDPAGNKKLDKSRSSGRIDPAVAICNAFAQLEDNLIGGNRNGSFWGEDNIWGEAKEFASIWG